MPKNSSCTHYTPAEDQSEWASNHRKWGCPDTKGPAMHDEFEEADRLSGAPFNVDQTTFRCVGVVGLSTFMYECNRCTSLVTDPERHLNLNKNTHGH